MSSSGHGGQRGVVAVVVALDLPAALGNDAV